ncbi:hypothetical protein NKR74_04345 [Bacillus sp. 3103sda1]|uniref:hypothetical protein n=1 Tax=Bacillus sp. 3103sda1 TaxID=2953808 RepID=UPI00209CC277|nr:hypothetical protein [Bacillus sp. 3103sda1]MCP1122582.1 hypothetical protein [Bacillus sp. 3103sda1]
MHAQMTDGSSGGGGGSEVLVNFTEMVDIATRLQNIYNLYADGVAKNIDSLTNCDFYRKGEATEVIKRYNEILGKTMELADNYKQAALLVNYTLEEMIKKDEELQKILGTIG